MGQVCIYCTTFAVTKFKSQTEAWVIEMCDCTANSQQRLHQGCVRYTLEVQEKTLEIRPALSYYISTNRCSDLNYTTAGPVTHPISPCGFISFWVTVYVGCPEHTHDVHTQTQNL